MAVEVLSAEAFSPEEQRVLLACVFAQVADIHQPLYEMSEKQRELGAEMADHAHGDGQITLECLLRGPLEDIEDIIDFSAEQWVELERFQLELQLVVDAGM